MSIDTLQIKLSIPCVQGEFNGHLATYATQIRPMDVVNLLGHDPRSKFWSRLPEELREIYQFLQRKTAKDRRESIAGYIEERFGDAPITIGAFPAVSICIMKPAEFVAYQAGGAVGDLKIDLSVTNTRILIDGLGRVAGALDLADEGKLSVVNSFSFPLTIFAPHPDAKGELSWKQMGQLFHDFNYRVHPVSRQHAIALDTSDMYIALANILAQSPFIRDNGGVAERAASLGKKSTELVVQSVLVRAVRGACEGRKFQESNLAHVENGNLTRENLLAMRDSLEEFFGGLATRMGERFVDRQGLHMTAPGWQALGVVYHDIVLRLKMSREDRDRVLDRIAQIDWSRYNPEWIKLGLGVAEIDKKTGEPVKDESGRARIALTGAGRSNVQRILDFVREKAQYANMLPSEEPEAAQLEAAAA